MKKSKLILTLSFFVFVYISFSGCKKEEGQGGTSTITGRVMVHDFDAAWLQVKAVYPATNEDTYQIYGTGHTTYDDDYKTSYDGTYTFKYLQKGKYRMFVYSKDTTGLHLNNPSGNKIPVFVDVEITSNGSTVTAPDLIILKNNQ